MKKAFTLIEMLAVIIILAVLSVLTTAAILKNVRDKKVEISDAMKEIVITASDLYTSSNRKEYPDTNGNIYCVTLKTLVEQDYLNNPIIDPTSNKEIDQNNFVKISINDSRYSYDIVSECEENRKEGNSLVALLKKQYEDTNTTGLLKENDSYYYKGTSSEVANNFVWYEGHLWRVIQVNSDNSVLMITQQPITAIAANSEPWKTQLAYESSYVNSWLNNVFYNSINDKSKIQKNDFDVSMYSLYSNAVTLTTKIATNQYVGLLDINYYIRAGNQNSFLDIKDMFTLSAVQDSLFGMWYAYSDGTIGGTKTTDFKSIRPVIRISDLTITSGEGSLINPFREDVKSTNTSNVKPGEYISVPGSSTYCNTVNSGRCLFRVIDKDNDSVKVILNGVLRDWSTFGSSSTFSTTSTMNTLLTNFSNSISNVYRYSEKKTFNIGIYADGSNYTETSSKSILNNVGLPTVGELFSGNDIDVSSSSKKTFVNPNTIENPAGALEIWVMNAYSSTHNLRFYYTGELMSASPGNSYGVRPVMFLNKSTNQDLTFTKGDGTAENPFWLGN